MPATIDITIGQDTLKIEGVDEINEHTVKLVELFVNAASPEAIDENAVSTLASDLDKDTQQTRSAIAGAADVSTPKPGTPESR